VACAAESFCFTCQKVHNWYRIATKSVFGRSFLKRFALCYLVLSVSKVGVLWPNGLTDQDELGMQVGLGHDHMVLDVDPAPPLQRDIDPLQPNGCIDQVATWYGGRPRPGDFVLDGDPTNPSPKGGVAPKIFFGPCLLWPNGWVDQDGTWHGDRSHPRRLCIKWEPSLPPKFSAHVYYSYCENLWFR